MNSNQPTFDKYGRVHLRVKQDSPDEERRVLIHLEPGTHAHLIFTPESHDLDTGEYVYRLTRIQTGTHS